MKDGDRVILELTHDQAKIVEKATELLFRLHIGQFKEIKWALMCREETATYRNANILNETLEYLKALFYPRLRKGESFNIDCCEDCNIAYNVYQAIRYVNAWHQNPEGSIGVNFDPPFPNAMPIPKCYLVKEDESLENDG